MPKKTTFKKPTGDTLPARLRVKFGEPDADAERLKQLVWFGAFRLDSLDDPLIVEAVEHFDLYDLGCVDERYRRPRRTEA
jgi:hypothetical protein